MEEPEALRARVVLLRDRQTPDAADDVPAVTAHLSAAPAARELALSHDTPISDLEPTAEQAVERAAELLAITDFAAVYLTLAGAEGS